jgi:hypothetical protein
MLYLSRLLTATSGGRGSKFVIKTGGVLYLEPVLFSLKPIHNRSGKQNTKILPIFASFGDSKWV